MEAQAVAVEVEKPMQVIELAQNARQPIPWQLWLYPDRWVFHTAGQEPQTITREHLRKWVEVDTLATFGMLQVTLGKKLLFPLKPEAREALNAWVGPPTKQDLVAAIKKNYGVGRLVFAALMVLMATPLFMPTWLAPTNAEPLRSSVDWVLMIWGCSTLVGWCLSRVAPHRALFLIDVGIQLVLGAVWAYGIVIGERTWWLAIIIVMMMFGAHISMKHYKRFAKLG